MQITFKIIPEDKLETLHFHTLKVLENPGMKILEPRMLEALDKKGARVDFSKKIVSFSPEIINETIKLMQNDIFEGNSPIYMNGVTTSKTKGSGIKAKFGGACVQFLDWEKKEYRDPDENDLINMVRLGEAIPEVKVVGNPVVYIRDKNNIKIDPGLQRIKTAAIVAKYTKKPGPTEVWNEKELDYLMEIGVCVKNSIENYMKEPCFITAKETISPLILEENSASVLIALAKRGLPCTIIPMPITGVSSPVSLQANIIIGNAEILGVAAALKSVNSGARIIGGVISGTMDMATGTANFGTPEAALQDLGLAQLQEDLYGFNFGIGGYLDAKYPGIQNAIEKTIKFFLCALSGRHSYPVGLVSGGKCFSPEEAIIDIQICQEIHNFLDGVKFEENNNEDIISLIRKVGIGGSFLQEEHTLLNFRKYLYIPELFDHTLSHGLRDDFSEDMLVKAGDKVKKILHRKDLYEIDFEKSRIIDGIVKRAEKNLI